MATDKWENSGHTNPAFSGEEYRQDNVPLPTKASKDEENTECGFGSFKSRKLQFFNKIQWMVVWLCVIGFVEGAAVNGFTNIILTTLERRFTLLSSQSGLIVSSTDIGAMIFVLFVSYLGSKGNRPRWLAAGTWLMCLGSLIFLFPHFTSKPYDYLGQDNDVNGSHICDANKTDPCSTANNQESSGYLYVFMLAQFVHGIGFTPFFTLGSAYVDDNATTESTAVYLSLIYALTGLGVAAGFIVGGQFLNIWVDFDRVDTDIIYDSFSPTDPVWVGAWWIGYIFTAILFFLFAFPVFMYPKNLPGTAHIREARLTDADREKIKQDAEDRRTLLQKAKQFPKILFQLVSIIGYDLVILGACAETLIIGGLSAFAPKILEEKFDITPADAGFIMGAVTIVGGAGGMVLGGVLIKLFKLEVRGMLRLCVLMSLLALVVGAGFFINCPEQKFAGLNAFYPNTEAYESESLSAPCNTGCLCSEYTYEPICGEDGFTYFSPCHAGCSSNYTVSPTGKTYGTCACVALSNATQGAVSGECGETCSLIWAFCIMLFIGMLLTFTTVTPASMVILRCVPGEHRALGLGLQWVALRLLGTIPGPVLTGSVIDSSCGLWQDLCGDQGSCWVYDRQAMSWRLFLWWIAVKIFSAAMFFLSGFFVKPQEKDTQQIEVSNKQETTNAVNGLSRSSSIISTKL